MMALSEAAEVVGNYVYDVASHGAELVREAGGGPLRSFHVRTGEHAFFLGRLHIAMGEPSALCWAAIVQYALSAASARTVALLDVDMVRLVSVDAHRR